MSVLSNIGSGLTDNVAGIFGLAAIDKDLLKPEVVLGYGQVKNASFDKVGLNNDFTMGMR